MDARLLTTGTSLKEALHTRQKPEILCQHRHASWRIECIRSKKAKLSLELCESVHSETYGTYREMRTPQACTLTVSNYQTSTATSNSWSGYVIQPSSQVNAVGGTWVEPTYSSSGTGSNSIWGRYRRLGGTAPWNRLGPHGTNNLAILLGLSFTGIAKVTMPKTTQFSLGRIIIRQPFRFLDPRWRYDSCFSYVDFRQQWHQHVQLFINR